MARTLREKAILKALGDQVRNARLARGLTQEGLGELACMDRTYVGGVERGEKNPGWLVIHRLVLALGGSTSTLLPEVSPEKRKR